MVVREKQETLATVCWVLVAAADACAYAHACALAACASACIFFAAASAAAVVVHVDMFCQPL